MDDGIDGWMTTWMDGWMVASIDGWMVHRSMDDDMDGWMYGDINLDYQWMDRLKDRQYCTA